MKSQKKLNVVLIVLVIVLISIISFVGVYHLEKNEMVSVLPNYILGTNISGYRKVTLEVINEEEENSSSETVILGEDEENNEVVENEVQEPEQNEEEVKKENTKNYKKSAEVLKARLKSLNVEDFNVSLDEATGKIEISLPENDQTDIILADIVQKGKFEITDTNTGEVLLNNDDVKSVDVGITNSYGYSIVVMNINFKLSATNKFKTITENYNTNAVIEVEANEVGNTETNTDENTVSNETSEENSTEETKTTEEVAKTIDLKIDDTNMLSTGFSEVVDNGVMPLTIGTSTDEDEIKESLYGGYNVAAIIENDPIPVDYEVTGNIYVQATINMSNINIIVYVLIAIAVVLSIFMIIKFKMKGLLGTILSVGYIAILLLAVRYANVTLSVEGILALGLSFIANWLFNYLLLNNLKNKNLTREERILKYKDTIKKYSLILVPLIIMSVVCCFINWDSIYSFGMVLFWGAIISIVYNLIIPNLLVRNK